MPDHRRAAKLCLAAILVGVLAMPHPAFPQDAPVRAPGIAALTVTSSAFADNTRMPDSVRSNLLTCNGQNRSPPIAWGGAPAGTKSFALEMIETDGVTGVDYTHWLVFDLSPEARAIAEGAGSAGGMPPGPAVQGYTDPGAAHYAGPCPLPGQERPHHYVTTVYALTVPRLGLDSGATLARLRAAIRGKVLAQGTITGLFGGPEGKPPLDPVAVLTEFTVKPGEEAAFRAGMEQALSVLARQPGHLSHEFGPMLDDPTTFWLHVRWASLAYDTERFQKSPDFAAFDALQPHLARPATTSHYAATITDGVAQ